MALRPKVLTALILTQVLFGFNYAASKIIVTALPPVLWASVRALTVGFCLLGYVALRGYPRLFPTRTQWTTLLKLALLVVTLNQACFLIGLKYTTATHSALINTLIPIFTLLVVILQKQEQVSVLRSVGVLIAFAGVLVLFRAEAFSIGSGAALFGDFLTLINSASYGCYLAFSKRFLERHDRLWATAWLFLIGSLFLSLIALPEWVNFHLPSIDLKLAGCFLYGIYGGTLAAYFLVNWSISQAPSSTVGTFAYLQPLVATVVSILWLGEVLTARTVVAGLLIFTGVVVTAADGRRGRLSRVPL